MIQIRRSTYRDRAGFLICGKDARDRTISIFTITRGSAERIRDKVKAGIETCLEDFESAEGEL